MASNIPAWMQRASQNVVGHPVRTPKPRTNTMPMDASAVQSKALRAQTAAQSHNVFRPDIYRVSEGYLN